MGLLKLVSIVLSFGMALPEAVCVIAEVPCVVYATVSIASKPGIGAAIKPATIAEARPAAPKGARMETVKSSAVKAAESTSKTTEPSAAEATEPATERRRSFDASGEAYRGDAGQQRKGECSTARHLLAHGHHLFTTLPPLLYGMGSSVRLPAASP